MDRSRQRAREISPRHTGRRPTASSPLSILFFPAAILYQELLLRLFDRDANFFGMALLRILLFSLAAGLLLFLILDLLPWRRAARIAGGVLLGVGTVLFCIERGCRSMFSLYFGPTTMGVMAADIVGEFGSTVWVVVLGILPFIILSLAPLAAFIWLRNVIISDQVQDNPIRVMLATALVASQLVAFLLSFLGGAKGYYTYDFTANNAVPNFGLVTSLRLELEYAIAGTPAAPPENFIDDPIYTPPSVSTPGVTGEPTADPTGDPTADPTPTPTPIPSGPNALDIDFAALAAAETDKTLKGMHEYFASVIPSEKNRYTGMFEGKNLIFITAEAFSSYVISEELTPTLYRLSHEGFVFTNYYQPDWTMSTLGGEFANTTGVIPNWIGGKYPTLNINSGEVKMPLTLAHQFAALGYSVPAWHNHTYTFYNRDKYLTAFGYDYKGIGNGLEYPEELAKQWPKSDLIMMENTVDSYIDDYVNNGQPFHAYYMTVSGHTKYNFKGGNKMSSKNKAAAQAAYPDASETVQAYIAANLELEYALEYLVDKLEAAGIADDTLIVLGADHYPYDMASGDVDYYNELRGFEDTEKLTTRYKNTLIMWSGCIEEPIIVDTPCYSCDIVPTISNLFGLEYDSRLYSGRDIFATNYEANQYSNCMPLVVFANNKGQGNSWITAAGVYEASTGTFTPNEGVTIEDQADYVAKVKRLVSAKINYAKLIIQHDYYGVLFPDGFTPTAN